LLSALENTGGFNGWVAFLSMREPLLLLDCCDLYMVKHPRNSTVQRLNVEVRVSEDYEALTM
jgi:hypothetical protein